VNMIKPYGNGQSDFCMAFQDRFLGIAYPYKAIAGKPNRIKDTEVPVNKNYAVRANILYQRNTVARPVGH
jgi:hypothetical protein